MQRRLDGPAKSKTPSSRGKQQAKAVATSSGGLQGKRRKAAEAAAVVKAVVEKDLPTFTWNCKFCTVILQRHTKHKFTYATSNHLSQRHPGARHPEMQKIAKMRNALRSARDKRLRRLAKKNGKRKIGSEIWFGTATNSATS